MKTKPRKVMYETWDNVNKCIVEEIGVFHRWSKNTYTTAIIECPDGSIVATSIDYVHFI